MFCEDVKIDDPNENADETVVTINMPDQPNDFRSIADSTKEESDAFDRLETAKEGTDYHTYGLENSNKSHEKPGLRVKMMIAAILIITAI